MSNYVLTGQYYVCYLADVTACQVALAQEISSVRNEAYDGGTITITPDKLYRLTMKQDEIGITAMEGQFVIRRKNGNSITPCMGSDIVAYWVRRDQETFIKSCTGLAKIWLHEMSERLCECSSLSALDWFHVGLSTRYPQIGLLHLLFTWCILFRCKYQCILLGVDVWAKAPFSFN